MQVSTSCTLCRAARTSLLRTGNLRYHARASISSSALRLSDQIEPTLDAREQARKRAWYLEEDEGSPAPYPARLPRISNSPTFSRAGPSRQPVFTRYDPQSTNLSPSTSPSLAPTPFPPEAPVFLRPLHALLTSSDLLEPSSIRFLHTDSANSPPDAELARVRGRWQPFRSRLRERASEAGSAAMFGDVGPKWEWVIVGEVRGRGKGVVARAERMVRLWLRNNPVEELSTPRAKLPRLDAETDWALIPVGKDGEGGVCVNLFTEEGGERWALEELWRRDE